MKIDQSVGSSLEFFMSLPDDVLIQIALNDWQSLEQLCTALTLDIQLLNESYENSSNRRNLC